ncbi:MAG TPA: carboxypeptidase-like regulatory domain-containing protein [Vicinamibacterales bacterium]|nr:carboxypeptidase-like regulatory domain-containing protein [Vicinamibacterales bacterium]
MNGEDVSGVTINMLPGPEVFGHVTFDKSPANLVVDPTQFQIRLSPLETAPSGVVDGSTRIGSSFATLRPSAVQANGTFGLGRQPPGRYRIECITPTTGWHMRSAMVEGLDTLDDALEITLGGPSISIAVIVTDRHTELRGRVITATGDLAAGYEVVVFPSDRTLWRPRSRRIKSAGLSSDGTFAFVDLPAGEYWLAALVGSLTPEWQGTEFLAAIAPMGVPVSVVDGQTTVHDLHLRSK